MVDEARGQGTPTITRSGGYPTIGLLTARVSDELGASFWNGAFDAAREGGANLVAFAGGILHSPHGFEVQANVLYDLAHAGNVDGLVIDGGLLSDYVGLNALEEFCARHSDLPQVVVEVAVPGIPNVLVDFYQGMREVIAHLIQVHGFRRIGFIRGPEESATGQDRFLAYVDTLAEHGIAVDPELIVPGTFFAPSGAEAVRLLLDERGVSLEALAAANDFMALDALQALQARGIRVPEDMALVGFDDWKAARLATPPLTTARLHNYERARRATSILLARLRGESTPEQAVILSEMVLRQSCGCSDPAIVQAAVGSVVPTGQPLAAALTERRQEILGGVAQALGEPMNAVTSARAEQLLDAFSSELTGQASGRFLPALARVLAQLAAADEDVAASNGIISALRRHTLPYLDRDTTPRAEDLCHQARVMIAETAQRAQAYEVLLAQQQAQTLQDIGQAFATQFDLQELTDLIALELPRLNIAGCYLSLYDGETEHAREHRLMLAYNAEGRAKIEQEGQPYPGHLLAPPGVLPQDRLYHMVVEPLYFGQDQLGFVLFEVGSQEVTLCDTLRGQISSALKGVLQVRQLEARAVQLRTAAEVSHIVGSILEPQELMQQAVDLVRERFGLYYVGLFLTEEEKGLNQPPGMWAVLQAGTGQAGQEMLKRRHRLEVGGNSMVGQCVATGQPSIVQDVGKEGTHFDNPLLPETRSEMALPLISRGATIGALTIQSARKAAFAQADIAVLQTMASQLANAIENARLYQRSEAALAEVKAIQRQYILDGWDDYLGQR